MAATAVPTVLENTVQLSGLLLLLVAVIGVITLNVLIGMIQEGKAEKAAEAIKAMLSATGALHACFK
jgi:magnesium-transporting ATPase (P-type)